MKLRENLFQRLASLIRETTRLNDYVDTSAAEKSIRNNIYFRGPNAWILAIATIIASVGHHHLVCFLKKEVIQFFLNLI